MTPKKRSLWGTRFGFYLAAIGSAFGLGNLWRFPYVTAENGGGAFVLLYVLAAIFVGLPLLIGELMLGKLSRQSVISATQQLDSLEKPAGNNTNQWVWAGRFSILVCAIILSYYAVISGWVLHFIVRFFVGHISSGGFDAELSLQLLRDNGWLQMALTSVHLLISLIIVAKGVQAGMEKWVSNAMPVFVILLVVLVTKSLSLSSATEALRFLVYPDFTKLNSYSMLHAIGHVFFTLSIGMGTMVTFGSYLNERTHIPSAGFRVTVMDTVLSLFAGLLIFPLLMSSAFQARGPEILFQTVPMLLSSLDSGFIFGMAFFICLYLAALGASIGLLESLVANVLDFKKFNRSQAVWLIGIVTLGFAAIPALSNSVFRSVQIGGYGLLQALDTVLINGMLPLAALGIAAATIVRVNREQIEKEFVNDDSIATRKMYSHWIFAMKWLAPGLIITAFVVALLGVLINRFS